MSLPNGECGLKLAVPPHSVIKSQSLPNGECGLKYEESEQPENPEGVAPQWGVWIEITNTSINIALKKVAPQWGVWIEIRHWSWHLLPAFVAPQWGVWIEIRKTYLWKN